jgi:hypothetical protein
MLPAQSEGVVHWHNAEDPITDEADLQKLFHAIWGRRFMSAPRLFCGGTAASCLGTSHWLRALTSTSHEPKSSKGGEK